MPNLERTHRGQLVSANALDQLRSYRTARALTDVRHRTIVRMANVQGEGMVQAEKVREVNHLTREAMSDHALLGKWRETLATADPFLLDELRFFTDIARIGTGEIIADTIDTYCRESRS